VLVICSGEAAAMAGPGEAGEFQPAISAMRCSVMMTWSDGMCPYCGTRS